MQVCPDCSSKFSDKISKCTDCGTGLVSPETAEKFLQSNREKERPKEIILSVLLLLEAATYIAVSIIHGYRGGLFSYHTWFGLMMLACIKFPRIRLLIIIITIILNLIYIVLGNI